MIAATWKGGFPKKLVVSKKQLSLKTRASEKVPYHRGSKKTHCMKSVPIQSFFWSILSCIRTEYGDME